MNYGTLETELVSRLNNYFIAQLADENFEAAQMPENTADQVRAFEKGKVYVQYFTSTYNPTQSINEVSQHETITIRLTFETRDYRGTNGLFNLLTHVKTSLLGYKPANCTKRMTIDKYDLIFFENNSVSPYLDFKTETLNVMVMDDTEEGPLFKKVIILLIHLEKFLVFTET